MSEFNVACGPSVASASANNGSGGTRHSQANRSNIGTSLACRSRRLPIAKLIGEIISTANAPAHSPDRKSTRLNSSHQIISYAVFCLKKKKKKTIKNGQEHEHKPRPHYT